MELNPMDPSKPQPFHTMRLAIVVPEEQTAPAMLGRWLGENLSRVQLVARRRRRTRKVHPNTFDVFVGYVMPWDPVVRRRRRA